MIINFLIRTTPTMRYRNKFIFFRNKFFKNPKFFEKIKAYAGKNNKGATCVLSKKHKKPTRAPGFFQVLPAFVWNVFVKWTEVNTQNNKRYSVYECTGGNTFILPKVFGNTVGSFYKFKWFYTRTNVLKTRLRELHYGLPCFIKSVPFFYIISNIFMLPVQKFKYVVSSGTHCTKIPTDKRSKLLKIVLPSGVTRFFSPKTLCLIGPNPFLQKKLFKPGKAGVCSLLGNKPKVRGVAKNPVDHPNGGRTKSCAPEKSPWGWIAKLNK